MPPYRYDQKAAAAPKAAPDGPPKPPDQVDITGFSAQGLTLLLIGLARHGALQKLPGSWLEVGQGMYLEPLYLKQLRELQTACIGGVGPAVYTLITLEV